MYIRKVRIDRYGALQDRNLTLPEGLTVVYGPNEAGKSSVLGLIRSVLYGFPVRDGAEAANTGLWSGAVTLGKENSLLRSIAEEGIAPGSGLPELGEMLVERKEALPGAGRTRTAVGGALRITLEDGRIGGEANLREQLGGIGSGPFQSVFAFSLSELQELRTLQSEELSAFLYSTGLGLDGRVILSAERRLAQELEQLYRPRGKNQPLSAALRDIERLEAELRESRGLQERYDGMAAELQRLDAEIAADVERLRQLQVELAWLGAAEQAIVHRRQSRAIARELAALPVLGAFPPDARLRFERLQVERRRAAAERERLEETEAELSRQLAERPAEEPALLRAAELEPLLAELASFEQDRRAIVELEQEAAQLESEIGSLLRQSGAGWTAERLAELPATVPTRERIREHREVLESAKAERSAASAAALASERERSELGARAQRLWHELAMALPALGLEPADAPSLRSRLAALRRSPLAAELPALRRLVRQREQLRLECELAGAAPPLQADPSPSALSVASASPAKAPADRIPSQAASPPAARRTAADAARDPAPEPPLPHTTAAAGLAPSSPRARRRAGSAASQDASRESASAGNPRSLLHPSSILQLAALLLLAVAVAGLALAPPASRLAALAAAAGLTLAAAALALAASRLTRATGSGSKPAGATASLERLLRDAEAALADRLAAASALPEVAAAGLLLAPQAIREETLDRLERQAQLWQQAADEADRRFRAWEAAAAEEEAAGARHNRDRDRLQHAEQDLAAAAEAWTDWLRTRQLPVELSPDAAGDLLHRLDQAQERLSSKERANNRREAIIARQRDYEMRVAGLFGPGAAKDPVAALRVWERDRREAEDRQATRRQLIRDHDQIAERQALLQKEEDQLQEAISRLWQEAGAGDENSFHRQLERKERVDTLLQEQHRLDGLVEACIGSGAERLARLDEWLAADESFTIPLAIRDKRQEAELLERSLDERKDRRGRLSGELEQLEEGTGHADKLQRLEEHKAALDTLAGEWAARALAAGLLRSTKSIYERERQPALLRAASSYLRKVTGGRYVRIVMPLGEQRLAAEHSTGELVDSTRMSRGTAEQLYLAMRFALADEMEQAHKTVLPMVMDEVFVNFDRERLGCTLRLLGELAQRRQLLYFTCHSHVIDAFRDEGIAFHEIRLDSH